MPKPTDCCCYREPPTLRCGHCSRGEHKRCDDFGGDPVILRSWSNMKKDEALAGEITGLTGPEFECSLRERLGSWFTWYWWPTRRWMPKVSLWWHYNVLRYPKPAPLEQDPVAMALGLVPDPHDGSAASVRAAELRRRQAIRGG